MSTKIRITVLALCTAGIVCFTCMSKSQTQELSSKPMAIPSADSSTKKVVDSTIIIRDEFVAQKESIKDKIDYLQQQQRRIKETQRQLDSAVIVHSVPAIPIIIPQ